MPSLPTHQLPTVIAGPILRRVVAEEVVWWLVTTTPDKISLKVSLDTNDQLLPVNNQTVSQRCTTLGQRCFIQWLTWQPAPPLSHGSRIYYDFWINDGQQNTPLSERLPYLRYPNETSLSFLFDLNIHEILHGSCRKPHYNSDDALLAVDQRLSLSIHTPSNHPPHRAPNFLLMTGDQVYIDDVAGPTLYGIHQVINLLGLYDEKLLGAQVTSGSELYRDKRTLYRRHELLPHSTDGFTISQYFLGGIRKPIFTTTHGDNHLITLAEMLAMYLLV